MANNILSLTRCLVRSHRVLGEATQFLSAYTELSYQRKSECFFTQSCKPAATSTQPSLHQRHCDNKKIQEKRERMSIWLKDGFSCRHLLQNMDDYHGYCYYEFLFLLLPVYPSVSVVCPTFSLQLPYKMPQLPPPTPFQVMLHTCEFSLLLKNVSFRPSYEEQGQGEQKACD